MTAVLGSVTHVSSDDFNKIIKSDKLVVVDFYATWCGPCTLLAPKLEDMAKNNTNVIFIKVDVDKCEDLAVAYNVSAMPTIVAIKNGNEVERVLGANSEHIEKMIKKLTT